MLDDLPGGCQAAAAICRWLSIHDRSRGDHAEEYGKLTGARPAGVHDARAEKGLV